MSTVSPHHADSKQNKDGIDWIAEDHVHINHLFDEYARSTSSTAKQALVDQLIKDISQHASAEERVAYPLISTRLRDKILYDRNVMDDQVNKQLLHWLETHRPTNDHEWEVFDRTVLKFKTIEQEHLKQEEDTWMKSLRAVMTEDELHKLWEDLEFAKKTAPPHPHPSGPSTAPAANILHPVAAAIDAVVDKLTALTSSH